MGRTKDLVIDMEEEALYATKENLKTKQNMKAILEFNLPEDDAEFQTANNAGKMKSVLWEMDNWLRTTIKHAPDTMSEDEYNTYKRCRDYFYELLNLEGINID